MRRIVAAVMGAVLLCTLLCSESALAGNRELVAKVLPNLVHLKAYDEAGEEISLGSGFFLTDGRIATNAHVLSGSAWVEVRDADGEYLGNITYASALSTSLDLAILPTIEGVKPGIPLAKQAASPGDEVWAFGSPLGLQGSVSTGIVAAQREYSGITYLQITAPISPGSSGGPVVNARGEAVGVAVGMLSEGQNVNFAIPAQPLSRLVSSAESSLSFPEDDGAQSEEVDPDLAWQALSFVAAFALADSIAVGAQFLGELDENDLQLDGPMDVVRFEGRQGQQIRISVESTDFDALAEVIDGSQLWEDNGWSVRDDDGGRGTNSAITTMLPRSGTYYLAIRAYDDGVGAYRATVSDARYGQGAEPTEADNRWVYVLQTAEGGGVYFDSRTMSRIGRNRRAWVKLSYDQVQVDGEMQFDDMLVLMQLDCESNKSKKEAEALHLGGELVSSTDIPSYQQEWSNVLPGTVGEAILDAICSH